MTNPSSIEQKSGEFGNPKRNFISFENEAFIKYETFLFKCKNDIILSMFLCFYLYLLWTVSSSCSAVKVVWAAKPTNFGATSSRALSTFTLLGNLKNKAIFFIS